MYADQAYADVTDLVTIFGVRNEICEANDRVHDQSHHRLVEKLYSSAMD